MKNVAEIEPSRSTIQKSRWLKGVRIKNILVPTDFSSQSKEALQYASHLAEYFGAKITVVHVIQRVAAAEDSEQVSAVLSRDREFNETRQMLEGFADQEIAQKFLKATNVRVGQPFDQIVRAAKDIKADMIIIACHGHGGGDCSVIGSTAERVVRFAPCPVLTIR